MQPLFMKMPICRWHLKLAPLLQSEPVAKDALLLEDF